jgi:hypothetical protein
VTKYLEQLVDMTPEVWEESAQKAVQEWKNHATAVSTVAPTGLFPHAGSHRGHRPSSLGRPI